MPVLHYILMQVIGHKLFWKLLHQRRLQGVLMGESVIKNAMRRVSNTSQRFIVENGGVLIIILTHHPTAVARLYATIVSSPKKRKAQDLSLLKHVILSLTIHQPKSSPSLSCSGVVVLLFYISLSMHVGKVVRRVPRIEELPSSLIMYALLKE